MGVQSFQLLKVFHETHLAQPDQGCARNIRVDKGTDKSLWLFFAGLGVVFNA